jgi:hypothetical protein
MTLFPAMDLSSTTASAAAFELVKADIQAKADSGELAALNVDATTVVRAVLTGWGNAQPYLPLIEQLPFVDLGRLKKLPSYALAFGHAHALHAWTLEGPKETDGLAEALRQARRVLVAELELMEVRNVLPKGTIKLQGTTSFHAMIEDVRAIGTAFMASWTKVGPQLGGSSDHVEAALGAADKLIAALAQSDQLQEKVRGTTRMRAAAWTLTYEVHRELERVVAFLRFHEGDAERIVPSLFVRTSRKRNGDRDVRPDDQELSPVTPVAEPAAAGSPGASTAANVPSSPLKPSKPFE